MNGYAFAQVRQPSLGWSPYRNGAVVRRPVRTLGQNAATEVAMGFERERISKFSMGIAALGGGTWAMMSLPGQKKVTQIAVGALGGGLLVAGITNVIDALV